MKHKKKKIIFMKLNNENYFAKQLAESFFDEQKKLSRISKLKNKKKNSIFCSVLFLQSIAFFYLFFRFFIPSYYQNSHPHVGVVPVANVQKISPLFARTGGCCSRPISTDVEVVTVVDGRRSVQGAQSQARPNVRGQARSRRAPGSSVISASSEFLRGVRSSWSKRTTTVFNAMRREDVRHPRNISIEDYESRQSTFVQRIRELNYTLDVEIQALALKFSNLASYSPPKVKAKIYEIKALLAPRLLYINKLGDQVKTTAQVRHSCAAVELGRVLTKETGANRAAAIETAQANFNRTHAELIEAKQKVFNEVASFTKDLQSLYIQNKILYPKFFHNALLDCQNQQGTQTTPNVLKKIFDVYVSNSEKNQIKRAYNALPLGDLTIEEYKELNITQITKRNEVALDQLKIEASAYIRETYPGENSACPIAQQAYINTAVANLVDADMSTVFQQIQQTVSLDNAPLITKVARKGTKLKGFLQSQKNIVITEEDKGRTLKLEDDGTGQKRLWSRFDTDATNYIGTLGVSAKRCVVEFLNNLGTFCCNTTLQKESNSLQKFLNQPNTLKLIFKYNNDQQGIPPFAQVVLNVMRTSNTFRDLHGINLKSNYHEIRPNILDCLRPSLPIEINQNIGSLAQIERRAFEKLEVHHVVLDSLGGPDLASNGVALTVSEHAVVHAAEELERLGSGKGSLKANISAAVGGTGNTKEENLPPGQFNRTRLDCIADITVFPPSAASSSAAAGSSAAAEEL